VFFQFVFGLQGFDGDLKGDNGFPHFGDILCKLTQSLQKVHSKLQIIAALESGGSGLLPFSQVGRSSSIGYLPR
jgi:hypothetical protein